MTESAAVTTEAIPASPRPLTPRVRRRSWLEPNVRLRWLFGLAMFLFGVWFGVSGLLSWDRDRKLLLNPPINGTIKQANEQTIVGRPVPREANVLMVWESDGQKFERWGSFTGYESAKPATIGSTVAIHVDPTDPNRWTARNEPTSLFVFLFPALACIAVALLAAALAWWRRRRVLRTWREGQLIEAQVLDWQFTTLAPRSRVAKCTLALEEGEAGDRRIFYVIVPHSAPAPKTGGTLTVLAPQESSITGRLCAAWLAG